MKVKSKILVLACVMALGMGLTAYASSATALLRSNETNKSTSCVGNTGGVFYWWGNVEGSSKYNVQFVMYGGTNTGTCSKVLAVQAIAPDGIFGVTPVWASQSSYSVGKVEMYGNTIENSKAECIAGCGISDRN